VPQGPTEEERRKALVEQFGMAPTGKMFFQEFRKDLHKIHEDGPGPT